MLPKERFRENIPQTALSLAMPICHRQPTPEGGQQLAERSHLREAYGGPALGLAFPRCPQVSTAGVR